MIIVVILVIIFMVVIVVIKTLSASPLFIKRIFLQSFIFFSQLLLVVDNVNNLMTSVKLTCLSLLPTSFFLNSTIIFILFYFIFFKNNYFFQYFTLNLFI